MSEIELLKTKIDTIISELHSIQIEMARHNEQENNHQKNIQRFWEQTWPETVQQIDENRRDIANQNVLLAQINTKILIFSATIITLIPIVATIVFKALEHDH